MTIFALVCLGLCAEAKPRLAFQVYGVRELCEKDFVVKPTLFPAQLDDLKASYAFLKKGK